MFRGRAALRFCAIWLVRVSPLSKVQIWGGTLRGGPADAAHGCLLWNELHLRNIETVRGFYRDVAGLEFRRSATDHTVFDVISAGGQKIATALELPDATRGRYQYWMPVFGVRSLSQALADVTEQGGIVLAQMYSTTALVQDNQGAGLLLRGK